MPKNMRKREAATLETFGFNTRKIARRRKLEGDRKREGKRAVR